MGGNVDKIIDRIDEIVRRRAEDRHKRQAEAKGKSSSSAFRSDQEYQEQVRRWKWARQFSPGF